MTKHKNRETYLENAVDLMRPMFKAHGFTIPKKVKVTCGWPSQSAGRSSKRRIGECWSSSASEAGNHEIIISMVLDEPVEVLATLLHELIHAVDNNENGHKGPFRTMAKVLGLEGKMTATVPGEALTKELKSFSKTLGKYPHAKIDFTNKKKQSTRMIKCQCVSPDCGMIFRTSSKWIDENPVLDCPACHSHCDIG
jgi:hypothetical protein